MPKDFYAVRKGFCRGIYPYEDALLLTNGYPGGAEWKGFDDHAQAEVYLYGSAEKARLHSQFSVRKLSPKEQAQAELDLATREQELANAEYLAARDKLERKTKAVEAARKKVRDADAPEDPDKKYYVVGYRVFDSMEAAAMFNGSGSTHNIYRAPFWSAAVDYVDRNWKRDPVKALCKDLSYKNSAGTTVYQVYVDGACSDNGDFWAEAGIGIYFGENSPYNFSAPFECQRPTNQKAELFAILRALQVMRKIKKGSSWELLTDSQYAIDCLTKYRYTWEKRGWYNSRGLSVLNTALIQACAFEMDRLNVTLKKVKGHGDSVGNQKADEYARHGIGLDLGDYDWSNHSRTWGILGKERYCYE